MSSAGQVRDLHHQRYLAEREHHRTPGPPGKIAQPQELDPGGDALGGHLLQGGRVCRAALGVDAPSMSALCALIAEFSVAIVDVIVEMRGAVVRRLGVQPGAQPGDFSRRRTPTSCGVLRLVAWSGRLEPPARDVSSVRAWKTDRVVPVPMAAVPAISLSNPSDSGTAIGAS